MISVNDYVAGWLDSSIHAFLEVGPRAFTSLKYALITCIDSNLDPNSLLSKSPELAALAPRAQPLGNGVLVPTTSLLEINAHKQLFFGFDEIWFFPTTRIEPKPDSVWLVGPARMDQAKLDKLSRWMSANSCSLALGDGEGLNFIVKARGLVKHLLGHSIDQPPPRVAVGASSVEEVA